MLHLRIYLLSCLLYTSYISYSSSFTCTGFDPVYSPQTKRDKFPYYSSYWNNNDTIPFSTKDTFTDDRVTIMNQGAQRYLKAIENMKHEPYETRLHRTLSTVSDPSIFNMVPFRLDKITLDPATILHQKQQVDLDYLVWLDPDSILYNFRNTSNLPLQGAAPFGGK